MKQPNSMFVILEACRLRALSRIERPSTLCFSFLRSPCSSGVKALFSCALSNCRITSKAICSWNFVSESKFLLHSFKSGGRCLELKIEAMQGLRMWVIFIPSIMHCFLESRHFNPEVLKSKGFQPHWSISTCKEERAVVGQGRGQCL